MFIMGIELDLNNILYNWFTVKKRATQLSFLIPRMIPLSFVLLIYLFRLESEIYYTLKDLRYIIGP